MEMEMQGYYGGGGGDGDWYHQMSAAFTVSPFCLSSSPPPMMSERCSLPAAAALPDGGPGDLVDCSSSFLTREEDMSVGYLPIIATPAAADGLDGFLLPSSTQELSTAGLDEALLMQPQSFSDIDLEAFGDVVAALEDPKPEQLDDTTAVVSMGHYLGVLHPGLTETVNQIHDHWRNSSIVVPAGEDHKVDPLDRKTVVPMDHFLGALHHPSPKEKVNRVARGVKVHDLYDNSNAVVGTETSLARCARRSCADGSAAAVGGRSLDHIGFDELRKYFYMPITLAAREMNVGLTVLKKRCRELGVARWPHRKMKSLRSLILNIQNGISSGAVQEELEALERYCARMEENPAIELTEETKKLRQACFKENYKRRRAVAVDMMDHCYNDFGHDHQKLRLLLPDEISRHSKGSGFFGYS